MKKTMMIAALAALALVACGEKEAPTIEQVMRDSGSVHKDNAFSFQTVEEQRAQGRANAGASAAEYQRQNPRLSGWETIVKADTTHASTCAQGDGWAEVVFMRTEREEGKTKNLQVEKATVMCSTVSTTQGCIYGGCVRGLSRLGRSWGPEPAEAMGQGDDEVHRGAARHGPHHPREPPSCVRPRSAVELPSDSLEGQWL